MNRTLIHLDGFTADHALGLLAALGLLQTIRRQRPEWEARLSWGLAGCWRATLTTERCAGSKRNTKITAPAIRGFPQVGCSLHGMGSRDRPQAKIADNNRVPSSTFNDGSGTNQHLIHPRTTRGRSHNHVSTLSFTILTENLPPFCLIDALSHYAYFSTMSTVAEIKAAIATLTLEEREEIARSLRPDWDVPFPQNETPPGVHGKLAEAAQGHFQPGDRSNISKILSTLK